MTQVIEKVLIRCKKCRKEIANPIWTEKSNGAIVVWVTQKDRDGNDKIDQDGKILVAFMRVVHNEWPCSEDSERNPWEHLNSFVRDYEWYTGAYVFHRNLGGWDHAMRAMEIMRQIQQGTAQLRESKPIKYGPKSRFLIFQRDNYRCQICGRTALDGMRLEVDHKTPRAKGGTNELANLWTLCWECNNGKRDRYL